LARPNEDNKSVSFFADVDPRVPWLGSTRVTNTHRSSPELSLAFFGWLNEDNKSASFFADEDNKSAPFFAGVEPRASQRGSNGGN